jgi:hypothetical protein
MSPYCAFISSSRSARSCTRRADGARVRPARAVGPGRGLAAPARRRRPRGRGRGRGSGRGAHRVHGHLLLDQVSLLEVRVVLQDRAVQPRVLAFQVEDLRHVVRQPHQLGDVGVCARDQSQQLRVGALAALAAAAVVAQAAAHRWHRDAAVHPGRRATGGVRESSSCLTAPLSLLRWVVVLGDRSRQKQGQMAVFLVRCSACLLPAVSSPRALRRSLGRPRGRHEAHAVNLLLPRAVTSHLGFQAPAGPARRDVAERLLCLPSRRHEAIAASAPGNPGSTCGALRSDVNGKSRACSSGRLNPG